MAATATPFTAAYLAEFEQEAETTRRVLQAVPAHTLDWTPHERSFPIGHLANHVAGIPGEIIHMLETDSYDFADGEGVQPPADHAALLETLDAGIASVREALDNWTEDTLAAEWKVFRGGKLLMARPRAAVLRGFLLNHLIHHRGQLTVYLRLLDVPVPSVYGPTADVDPFADA